MRQSHQSDDMNEFLAVAEHYRELLQETGRSAALLRRVEQRRSVAQDKAEGREAAYDKKYSETIAAAASRRWCSPARAEE